MNDTPATRSKTARIAATGIDWIIFAARIIGVAVVVIASVGAGEAGLAAHIGQFVASHAVF